MDDLTLMGFRLRELVEAKLDRILSLEAELMNARAELAATRDMLNRWDHAADRVDAIRTSPARVTRLKLSSVRSALKLHGPKTEEEILALFNASAYGVETLRKWIKDGHFTRDYEKRLSPAPPRPRAVEQVG